MNHCISSGPRTPSGFWRLWFGPAPKPSTESPKLWTRSFDMPFLSQRRIHLSASAREEKTLAGTERLTATVSANSISESPVSFIST
jgi:hypothetical protein